jgi:AraC family transcriptional regulator, glycine betaine-responsive activator
MKNEKRSLFISDNETLNLTFLVLSGTSIMCVASAIDPLRAANRIAGETLYSWDIVSPDGANPLTTSGLPVAVSGKFDADAHHEVLIVIAGFGTAPYTKEDAEDFRAAFPLCDVKPYRYVIDGPIFTCGGASPAFDLMLHLIRSRHGMAMALSVANVFVYDQPHAPSESQPLVSLGQLEKHDPRVASAIRMMETNIDAPLPVTLIAKRLTITARTLELVFQKLIGETPGHYYLGLRLAAARKMVTDTKLPMTEIATRTGFASAAAFSRAFARKFARAPTSLRS